MNFTGWIKLLSLLIINFHTISSHSGPGQNRSLLPIEGSASGDTLPDNQIFYNGRVWQNLYSSVRGDQFLFSKEFLPGFVTMRGNTYRNVRIRYDLIKDELLTLGNTGGVLQLNKEMVDSFSIVYQNRRYQFINLPADSLTKPGGYFNILYNGDHSLFVKYIKKVDRLADEGKYDKFYQVTKLYVYNQNIFRPVSSRNDLLKLSGSRKHEIRDFIRKNKIYLSNENPASFIPVLHYLDTLK